MQGISQYIGGLVGGLFFLSMAFLSLFFDLFQYLAVRRDLKKGGQRG